jgi:hypothetical protein
MPCMEMYATREVPRASVVREGRLKQLSSRHRLFGDRLKPGVDYRLSFADLFALGFTL